MAPGNNHKTMIYICLSVCKSICMRVADVTPGFVNGKITRAAVSPILVSALD